MHVFLELSLILVVATIISFIVRLLRQPLVVGYIITGILTGPFFLNILQSVDTIELFSKIGITILLFIVGLSLNPFVIKEVGKVSVVTGVGQVIFTSVIGFFIALSLGFDIISAVYTAIALTFSSTIIILKLLSDKNDLHKLYGKISIGFLIIQDIIATIILIIVASLKGAGGIFSTYAVGITLLKGVLIFGGMVLATSKFLPYISRFAAKSQELLFLFSLAWGLGFAALFHILGFSIEIGALVAGVTLSMTPFAYEIGSRVKPLRDFFIVLFFILLGSRMVVSDISSLLLPASVLSLFVLIGNPLIVLILMNFLGYKSKTSFFAGLTVAQISEFSLILVALGAQVGHISDDIVSLITLVGLITIAGSTYLIIYAENIYSKISGFLRFFEFKKSGLDGTKEQKQYDAILFGYDRVGNYVLNAFSNIDHKFLVVDFDPEVIVKLKNKNIPAVYGDADDPNLLRELDLSNLKIAVTAISDFKTNVFLIEEIKKKSPNVIIISMAYNLKEALTLYEIGALYVIIPHHLGDQKISRMIVKYGIDKKEYKKLREDHLQFINRLLEKKE